MRATSSAMLALGVLLMSGLVSPPAAPESIDLGGLGLGGAANEPPIEFIALDVIVDAGERELAAWQVEYEGVAADGGAVKLVGVEGGAHGAFAAAPHYDPAALAGGRVIIAAYSTLAELPSGQTRVARLHLSVPAGVEINHGITLIAAGDRAGDRLAATARVAPFQDQAEDTRRETPQGQDRTP